MYQDQTQMNKPYNNTNRLSSTTRPTNSQHSVGSNLNINNNVDFNSNHIDNDDVFGKGLYSDDVRQTNKLKDDEEIKNTVKPQSSLPASTNIISNQIKIDVLANDQDNNVQTNKNASEAMSMKSEIIQLPKPDNSRITVRPLIKPAQNIDDISSTDVLTDNIRAGIELPTEKVQKLFGESSKTLKRVVLWSQTFSLKEKYQDSIPIKGFLEKIKYYTGQKTEAEIKYEVDVGEGVCAALSSKWCESVLTEKYKNLTSHIQSPDFFDTLSNTSNERLTMLENKIEEVVYYQKSYERLFALSRSVRHKCAISELTKVAVLQSLENTKILRFKNYFLEVLEQLKIDASIIDEVIPSVQAIADDEKFEENVLKLLKSKIERIEKNIENLRDMANEKLASRFANEITEVYSKNPVETFEMMLSGMNPLKGGKYRETFPTSDNDDEIKEAMFGGLDINSSTGIINFVISEKDLDGNITRSGHRIAFSIDKTSEENVFSGVFFDPNYGELFFKGKFLESFEAIKHLYFAKDKQDISNITFTKLQLSYPKVLVTKTNETDPDSFLNPTPSEVDFIEKEEIYEIFNEYFYPKAKNLSKDNINLDDHKIDSFFPNNFKSEDFTIKVVGHDSIINDL